jgi:hypothetical protein
MKQRHYYHLALGIVCSILMASSAFPVPSPMRTLLTYISVINGAGRLSPGYEVRQVEHGSCEYGSPVLESSPIPVYMCATNQSTYLTCWYLAPPKPHSATAACLPLPWSRDVTEISTTAVPVTPVHAGTRTNLDWPWAVQLTTGKRCLPGPGPGQVISGLGVVDYYCGGPAFGLVNYADRDHSLWTFKSVRVSRSGKYVLAGQVAVGRAWFAGPATRSK